MYANSDPSQPGILWAGQGPKHLVPAVRHGHIIFVEGEVHLEGTVVNCRWKMLLFEGVTQIFLPSCSAVRGLGNKQMVLYPILPFAFETLKHGQHTQSCFNLFSKFPFALSSGGLAALVG